MSIGIYKITNKVNGKCYIGQSINIEGRLESHKCSKSNRYLNNAIRKYGLDNFLFEILELCSINDLDIRERYWISYFKSNNRDHGYNLTSGGESLPGWKHSDNSKYLMSIHNAHYGKKGILSPNYGKIAMTDGINTRYISEENISKYESMGFVRGKDSGYKSRMSIAKSDIYIYKGESYYGSPAMLSKLREEGYDKIARSTIMKIANGGKVKGYENLVITKISRK